MERRKRQEQERPGGTKRVGCLLNLEIYIYIGSRSNESNSVLKILQQHRCDLFLWFLFAQIKHIKVNVALLFSAAFVIELLISCQSSVWGHTFALAHVLQCV